jgi:predicted TIM-barrel fold metal-dependent hydrolase
MPVIDDVFVVEGVVHSYHFADSNLQDVQLGDAIRKHLYYLHRQAVPAEYHLDEARYRAGEDPDLLASALFVESQTDFAVYHETPIYAYFKDGGSALWVGKEMKRRWPERTMIYGAVAPLRPGAVERVDELVDEHAASALKLYPIDMIDGRVTPLDMGDPEVCFPIYERARERGIKVVAIHKSIPLGPGPTSALSGADVELAALAFPDLTFEIVHGGMAFVEETALELQSFRNIVVNLEATTALVTMAPQRFMAAIGAFLEAGGEDRIIWATGCDFTHPRPLIEAFWNLEFPDELRERHGWPDLTRDIKAKILGRNFLRLHGLDVDQLQRATAADELHPGIDMAPPWTRATAATVPA